MTLEKHVGIFFITSQGVILHLCRIEQGEHYGEFINFPYSHDNIWQKHYAKRFGGKAFDYFPRGRIIFHKPSGTYRIYHDGCTDQIAALLQAYYPDSQTTGNLDEHYQCRWCNPSYFDESRRQTLHDRMPDEYYKATGGDGEEMPSVQLIFRDLVFVS